MCATMDHACDPALNKWGLQGEVATVRNVLAIWMPSLTTNSSVCRPAGSAVAVPGARRSRLRRVPRLRRGRVHPHGRAPRDRRPPGAAAVAAVVRHRRGGIVTDRTGIPSSCRPSPHVPRPCPLSQARPFHLALSVYPAPLTLRAHSLPPPTPPPPHLAHTSHSFTPSIFSTGILPYRVLSIHMGVQILSPTCVGTSGVRHCCVCEKCSAPQRSITYLLPPFPAALCFLFPDGRNPVVGGSGVGSSLPSTKSSLTGFTDSGQSVIIHIVAFHSECWQAG